MNSPGPELAQVGPLLEESARARARLQTCKEYPVFLNNQKRGHNTIQWSHWHLQKPPASSISSQAEVHDDERRWAAL